MKKTPRHISKSRYCIGLQCLKRLWWQVHEPDAPELAPDPALQAVFDTGHRVGELARERFPGGVLVEFEPHEVGERVEATAAALATGARAVFEASFAAGGAFAALDVLEKRRGGFGVVEVKSTLSVKKQFLPDVALQVHAARAAGVEVRKAEVMHLNRECTHPDLSNLFVRADVTEEVEALLPAIPRQLRKMREALAGGLPRIDPGEHCFEPYDCPFAGRCHRELAEHDLATLYSVRAPRLAAWRDAGLETLHDLPDDDKLNAVQARQVRAVKTGKLVIEDGLAGALAAIDRPTAFLDFETVNPAVPAWPGCRPYQPVPVQMSCHLVGARGRMQHFEHLADGPGDPRPALAAAVVRACRDANTVVAWNSKFEDTCLAQLAEAVPSWRRQLQSIRRRLVDLLPIVRDHVYHPDFRGSFGLKSVAPALLADAGYEDLRVADGETASSLLAVLLLGDPLPTQERARTRRELLAYCRRDTTVLTSLVVWLGTHANGLVEANRRVRQRSRWRGAA